MLKDMLEKIKFDERYDSEEYGTTTLYFIAPKEMLNGKYPEAVHAEISIECPTEHLEAAYASVMLSPTRCLPDCPDAYEDYDWFDYDMTEDDVEALIALGKDSVPVGDIDTTEMVEKVNHAIKLIEACIDKNILLKTDGEHILTINKLDDGQEVMVSTSILDSAFELVKTNQEHVLEDALKEPEKYAKQFPLDFVVTDEYKFVLKNATTMYVYHNTDYKSPRGKDTNGWLCCTEGWHLKEDGKWHETVHCGWKPDRIVDSMGDILRYYQNKE